MNDPSMTSEQRYEAIVHALLDTPGVTRGGQGFGSSGLKVHNKVFAMLSSKQEFVVKLPRQRVDALVAAGQGERFDPRGDGRLMKEWLCVGPATDEEWLALAREALEFVGSTGSG
ncbi:MAG TPA: hypothetical protein VFZ25_19195 [Chloroflexota bacterium]|nr:hypothetical protein [Chloroflexota bacterium]